MVGSKITKVLISHFCSLVLGSKYSSPFSSPNKSDLAVINLSATILYEQGLIDMASEGQQPGDSKGESIRSFSATAGLSPNEWRSYVCNVQKSRLTPEVLEQLQRKAERHKRATKAYHDASIMEKCNRISCRAQETSLRKANYYSSASSTAMQHQALPAPGAAGGFFSNLFGRGGSAPPASAPVPAVAAEEWSKITLRSNFASSNIREVLSNQKSRRAESGEMMDEAQNYQVVSAQLEEMEQYIDEEEQEIEGLPAQFGVTAGAVPSTFEALLESLAVEPADAAELAAKFAIFENYLNSVVTVREQTVFFWDENKDQFTGAALAAGNKAVRDIDTENSMSINESSRRWFVFFMMQKAHENSVAIGNTLAAIRAKLELLTQEDMECPFCLDAIVPENGTTLGCCHKVCTPCWSQWQNLKGSHAFCPLCRHQEFVSELFEE
jgi:hypothetical protein